MNGIIWKTCLLQLKEKSLNESQWDKELPFALSNIRTLPSRSLGMQSPHEHLLKFSRRCTLNDFQPLNKKSPHPISLPEWLKEGRNAYYKNHTRKTKSDPLVNLVLVEKILSPYVVQVKFPRTDRSDTVSISHLSRAPFPKELPNESCTNIESVSKNCRPCFDSQQTQSPKVHHNIEYSKTNGSFLQIEQNSRPQRRHRRPAYLHSYQT